MFDPIAPLRPPSPLNTFTKPDKSTPPLQPNTPPLIGNWRFYWNIFQGRVSLHCQFEKAFSSVFNQTHRIFSSHLDLTQAHLPPHPNLTPLFTSPPPPPKPWVTHALLSPLFMIKRLHEKRNGGGIKHLKNLKNPLLHFSLKWDAL